LTVVDEGRPVPLYRAVAERLLGKYGISAGPDGVPLRDCHELHDAVSALAAAGRRVKDLYRPASEILRRLVEQQERPLAALDKLASIRHFDLYATVTSDDLLARALNTVRYGGAAGTEQIEYAPRLPTDRRRDIPEILPAGYTAVFYLFGKADPSPVYAIHDEDALEFSYTLQGGNGPERLLSNLRGRNLLLIGCRFGEWLSRFFLRLSSSERLFTDQRTKKEFLVGAGTAEDREFVSFLERFSQDSRYYSVNAREFCDELYERWSRRNPEVRDTPPPPPPPYPSSDTIFISYAKEDFECAARLQSELQEIGGNVAWFDKRVLKPGDEWERKILTAIERCRIFLPLLSSTTETRTEGFFRREWDEAAERSRKIMGRKFIFPVVIDEDYRGLAWELTPDRFRAFQSGHAPLGRMTEDLRIEMTEQLREVRRGRGV
jgi:hypothetical protein